MVNLFVWVRTSNTFSCDRQVHIDKACIRYRMEGGFQ
jgi:hypothetical protein